MTGARRCAGEGCRVEFVSAAVSENAIASPTNKR